MGIEWLECMISNSSNNTKKDNPPKLWSIGIIWFPVEDEPQSHEDQWKKVCSCLYPFLANQTRMADFLFIRSDILLRPNQTKKE